MLACTVFQVLLHLKREARDWSTYNEYSYRIVLYSSKSYCCCCTYRQTPIPVICSLLGACMYYTVYQVCCTWNERLETGVCTASTRISYNTTRIAAVCTRTYITIAHILVSLLNFGGVACRILFTASANTPKTRWEDNLLFLAEGK